MTENVAKKIGDINGWSAVLFRVQLVGMPILMAGVITLGTWLVTSVQGLQQTQAVLAERLSVITSRSHYTSDAARADILEMRTDVLEEVARKYPPSYLLQQIDAIERRLDSLEDNP